MSNRDDKYLAEYYQVLADIIAIFWEFHKDRIATGNIEFAYEFSRSKEEAKVFDFDRMNEEKEYSIIHAYPVAVKYTLNSSMKQFFVELGMTGFKQEVLNIPHIDSSRRFIQSYTRELCARAARFYDSYDFSDHKFRSGNRIVDGMDTGVTVVDRIIKLFGDEFNLMTPLVLSKTHLDKVFMVVRKIGIDNVSPDEWQGDRVVDNSLLDNSKYGVGMNRLKELGYGEALGCPAGMLISKETRVFLSSLGVNVNGTMLADFGRVSFEQFQKYILGPYNRLSLDQKKELIHAEETQRLLGGEIRREAVEKSCPSHKNSERR